MQTPTYKSRLAFGRFPFVAAIFLLTLVTAVSLRAQSSATFTNPVNVSQDSTADQPQMVVDSAGNVFIAYADTGPALDLDTIWVAHGTSSGGSFHISSAPVEVSSNAYPGGFSTTTNLSIAVESPCVIDVAYTSLSDPPSSIDLFVAQSTDCGATFASPVNVTNHMAGDPTEASPQLIISQGTVGVVWRANVSGTNFSQSIFYAQRNSASSFTTPSALVTSSSGVGSLTALLIPTSGNTAVGWCGDANGSSPGSVWFLPSVSGAQPIQVGTAPFAKFAVDPTGNVYVALSNSSGGSQFSRSIGPSGPFSPPVLFPGPGTVVMQMRADANGNLNLLFVQEGGGFDPGGNQTYEMDTLSFSRSVDQGSTFSNPAAIASYTSALPPASAFREPEMAIHSDGAADVAWTVEAGWSSSQYPQGLAPEVNTLLFSSRSNDDGTSFSAPVTTPFTVLNSDCVNCLQIATDSTDHVLVAWDDSSVFVTEGNAPSDFTITAAPGAQSVLPGGSANFPLTLNAGGGFSDTVNLTCTNLPPGAACAFNPASVTPISSGANVTLTITTPATLPQGNDSVTVSASSGGIQHTQSVQLAVGGLTGSLTPTAATIAAGSSGNFAVSMNSAGGFTGQLALSCSGVPSGMACSFNPPQVSVAANGTASSTLTVNVASQPSASMTPAQWPLGTGLVLGLVAIAIVVILSAAKNLSSPLPTGLRHLASPIAVLVLAIALISCSGATTASNTNPGTGASATGTTGTTGSAGTGTNGGTGTTGSSGGSSGGSGSSGSGSGGAGSGSGTGGSGGSGSGSGGSSITSQIIVQVQSGGATVTLGTASITVP